MVKGFQYDNKPEYRIIDCLKDFVGGEQSQNELNFSPVDISDMALREIHLALFKAAIDAGAMTIIAGHNDAQGVHCQANYGLLWDILRDESKFNGFVKSDWLDMERLVTLHKVAATWDNALTMSVNTDILARTLGAKFSKKRDGDYGGFGSFHKKVELLSGLIPRSGQQL